METINIECTAFEGNNNAYLFTEGLTTLIDTGAATPEIRSQLTAGLAEFGIAIEDIERVFLTHFHADHSGLVGEIQAKSGATVYAHPADAPLIEKSGDAWESLERRQSNLYETWGIPASKRDDLERTRLPERYGDPVNVTPCRPGEVFDINSQELTVVHTPGHTAGGISFEDGRGRHVFSGDALLPVYTPNVGGADVRVNRPLERYLETLHYFIETEPDRVYPGHRSYIDDPAERARTIFRHHEERAIRVLRTIDRLGSADAWTIATELFGELSGIHVRHGPGEIYAHTDHLERAGDVVRDGTEYRLTDETATRLARLEDAQMWPLKVSTEDVNE